MEKNNLQGIQKVVQGNKITAGLMSQFGIALTDKHGKDSIDRSKITEE